MRHDEHWYCEDHRPRGMRGVVYQMSGCGSTAFVRFRCGWSAGLSSLSKNIERGGKGGAMPNGSLSDEERTKRDADIPF